MDFTLGLDLGQVAEHSPLCAVERSVATQKNLREPIPPPKYAVRHLHRWPLGTPYPEIVAAVKRLVATPELAEAQLVVDATGVGRAVIDLVQRAGAQMAGLAVLLELSFLNVRAKLAGLPVSALLTV